MIDDILAQYRRTPSAPVAPPTEANEYVAFGTKDKVQRLRIKSAKPLVHSPGYNLLLDVVSDGKQGTHFILVYTALLVLVQGKNLQKLVFAIESGMAEYIQEFDPERWQKPTDANAPIIESIEIKITEGGSRYGDEAKHQETTHGA